MAPENSSQGLLAPAEISLPNTPVPSHAIIPASPGIMEAIESSQAAQVEKARIVSPAPPSSSADMTPPPSAQPFPSSPPIRHLTETTTFPASPPATVKPGAPATFHNVNILPTADDITNSTETELRQTVNDLLLSLREARMSAAHFKLQHQLLEMESAEAAKRAEIEHEMTKREIEVLQTTEYRTRRSATPHASQETSAPQIESLIRHYKELEGLNLTLNRRLKNAKKAILEERDKRALLAEENDRLRKRIKENREHTNRLRSQGPLAATPRSEFATPQRKQAPRFPDRPRPAGQDSFAALLAAGQALSGEAASVPSTPTARRPVKLNYGHSRGTHSLSSLPTTPSRPATADANFFTPFNKSLPGNRMSFSAPVSQVVLDNPERRRRDRDSTISVSDNEEAVTDDDVPASQASSLATSMLRRNPGSQEEPSVPTNPSKANAALQSKLFGQVKKVGSEKIYKRHASFGEGDTPTKKRMSEGVGLGIGHWGK